MASAAKGAAANRMHNALGLRAAAARGQQAAWAAGTSGASSANASAASGDASPPAWAQKLHAPQASRHRRQMAIHAVQSGDRGGAGVTPDNQERKIGKAKGRERGSP